MTTSANLKLDASLLITRLGLGNIVAAHGAQKLLGWFDGYGFDGTMQFFTHTIGLPYVPALGIVLLESVGMVALTFGLFTRFLSASLVTVMLGAIITTHVRYGFFMNWSGTQGGEGYEYHLLVITLSTVLLLNGAGSYSLDKILFPKSIKQVNPNVA